MISILGNCDFMDYQLYLCDAGGITKVVRKKNLEAKLESKKVANSAIKHSVDIDAIFQNRLNRQLPLTTN